MSYKENEDVIKIVNFNYINTQNILSVKNIKTNLTYERRKKTLRMHEHEICSGHGSYSYLAISPYVVYRFVL